MLVKSRRSFEDYPCVKAYVNGHNHEGNYGVDTGIHYLTLKGMVDTHETSYAIFNINSDGIVVKGFGQGNKSGAAVEMIRIALKPLFF